MFLTNGIFPSNFEINLKDIEKTSSSSKRKLIADSAWFITWDRPNNLGSNFG